MQTVSILYRCLIAILLCFLNLTQWSHRLVTGWIRRHRYTITVNIGVTRQHNLWTVKNPDIDNLKLNKPTDVVALIVNEQIPDVDLCQIIANAILFFRRLNIQHLIIYDYQGEDLDGDRSMIAVRSRLHQSVWASDHGLRSNLWQEQ